MTDDATLLDGLALPQIGPLLRDALRAEILAALQAQMAGRPDHLLTLADTIGAIAVEIEWSGPTGLGLLTLAARLRRQAAR